jgi:ribosomal protein L18E
MTEGKTHKIEVLCPPKKCKKCQRIIKVLEDFLHQHHIEAEIVIINEMDELITKNTWVLPTIIVNGKVLSRGYFPDDKVLIKALSY